ncbi:MAG: alpha/beta hydrolase [Pseudomonadota bacterium]
MTGSWRNLGLLDRLSRAMVLFAIASLVVGCAGPVELNDRFAATQGLSRSLVRGADFSHVIYAAANGEDSVWHIYIEGDGQPWQSRTSVAHDPTSPMPLMLRLMQQDAAPRIYLGRPCYQGMAIEAACKPWVWTHGRYSEPVVSSMQAALDTLIERHAINEIALFGHSGGGALAMLLAERIPQTTQVVTLAGNLDTEAWTRKHGYADLAGSLNPADRPELPGRISQFHFRGAEDRNLPFGMYGESINDMSGDLDMRIDGVGHATGWEAVYCGILSRTGGQCKSL